MFPNIFETVRDDAVRLARAGDPNVTTFASNFPAPALPATDAPQVTFPGPNGETIGPFVVDESEVDGEFAYML